MRGISQKRIVHLEDTKSKYFDEAYFVLKSGVLEGDDGLIKEAERIIGNTSISQIKDDEKRGGGLVACLMGAFSGAIVTFLICLPFVL